VACARQGGVGRRPQGSAPEQGLVEQCEPARHGQVTQRLQQLRGARQVRQRSRPCARRRDGSRRNAGGGASGGDGGGEGGGGGPRGRGRESGGERGGQEVSRQGSSSSGGIPQRRGGRGRIGRPAAAVGARQRRRCAARSRATRQGCEGGEPRGHAGPHSAAPTAPLTAAGPYRSGWPRYSSRPSRWVSACARSLSCRRCSDKGRWRYEGLPQALCSRYTVSKATRRLCPPRVRRAGSARAGAKQHSVHN